MESALEVGRRHLAAGQTAEAAACFRRALGERPDNREAMRQLAVLEYRAGRLEQAAEWFGRAAGADANGAEDYCNRGMILDKLGRREEAIAALRRALAIRPEFPEALCNLGISLRGANRLGEAIDVYRRATALMPDNAEAHNNLGNALCQDGNYEEAIGELNRAVALRPGYADGYYNLGIAYQKAGKIAESREHLLRAIEMDPDQVEAAVNLGAQLLGSGELEESIRVFRHALERQPEAAMVRWNLANALLLRGEYEEGWRHYEWRRRVPEFLRFTAKFRQPMYDGGDLRGKTILLYGEQGFGDMIHFARYATLVAERGGKVVLACPQKVLRLMRGVKGIGQFVSPLDQLPEFEVHCPLPSLPHVLGRPRPEDVPWRGAYLKSKKENREKFADFVRRAEGKLKVGLVWCGRSAPAGRSIPLRMLGALGDPGVQFYSLQIGEGSEEARRPPDGMNLIDATGRITDFADTAGLIDQMDLVIGIDTAVVQLAGAMGKPVWTMLKRWPDWRWLLDREDSPWYPTMRLFRQKSARDWSNVVDRVAEALRDRLAVTTEE